ncbi:SDR family NAD(P)-dependent oxidoreductase [Sciscionella marina]|uniref:SDR family NAD(P)-dependent oxidoreductase n=1 Tax=Sciscionella marina TaxID=508770 RepID=UPI0003A6F214
MNSARIIGASRTLGLGLATEFGRRGWAVTGTVHGKQRTGLHELAETSHGRVSVETLDMTEPEQISALRARLTGRTFDLLFVNAAITRGDSRSARSRPRCSPRSCSPTRSAPCESWNRCAPW